jgi:hypothetical protein
MTQFGDEESADRTTEESGEPTTEPRDNPETDEDAVEQGEEELDKVSGN